ncbi:outer membrane lipoprotein-sorting protein, partial [bacterium]|nr:outer membrane lipoprotein-sorting protein [bacterium]
AIEGKSCWILVSTPNKDAESSYLKIISWVDKSLHIAYKEEFYNLNGQLYKVKNTIFTEIKGYHIPVEIIMKNVIKNHQTLLTIENVELDNDLNEDLFQVKNLKRKPL